MTFWHGGKAKTSDHLPLGDLSSWDDEDEQAIQGGDFFISPGLRPHGLSSGQAGSRRSLVGLAAFAIDIDILAPEAHVAKNLPTSDEEAAAIVEVCKFDPTYVIRSGYGLHLWWFFHPISLFDRPSQLRAQRASDRFHAPFHKRAKELELHLDATAGIERWFRLPGSKNWKNPEAPRAVTVEYQSGTIYDFETLSADLEPPKPPSSKPPRETTTASQHLGGPEAVRATMKRVRPDHDLKDAFNAILAGESFAETERDLAIQRTVSVLVFSLDRKLDVDPEDISEVYEDSLAVWAAEPEASKSLEEEMEKVEEKAARAFEEREVKDAARAKDAEIIRRGLRVKDQEATEEEIPTSELPHLAILQYQSGFFAHSFGWSANPTKLGYLGPFGKDELVSQLDGIWENAPLLFDLEYENKKGEIKSKTVPTLMKEYGTGALELIGHLFLQNSYFDPVTRAYHRAFCPLRVLEPRFDPEIDEWLRLLGGEKADKLLDWVAAVPQIDRASCALYLEGPPGIGKSNILAFGLARLWREAGPASFVNLLDGYNADMFSCPFILLDEGLPKNTNQSSAFIRSLVAASEHTYSQKYEPKHKVLGSVRLLIAANNDRVLAQLANEELGEEDVEAVAERFLHIKTDDAAAVWIKAKNDENRNVIDSWLQDDLLAMHALWLAENRTIKPGRRFLVDGESTEMHRSLVTRGEKQGLVLEWLARFMIDPQRVERDLAVKKTGNLAQVGNGKLLMNTQVVVDHWSTYRQFEQKLTPTTIGRILNKLSHGKVRHRIGDARVRYHDINYDNVRRAAEDIQLDIDAMERNLHRTLKIEPEPEPEGSPDGTTSPSVH